MNIHSGESSFVSSLAMQGKEEVDMGVSYL